MKKQTEANLDHVIGSCPCLFPAMGFPLQLHLIPWKQCRNSYRRNQMFLSTKYFTNHSVPSPRLVVMRRNIERLANCPKDTRVQSYRNAFRWINRSVFLQQAAMLWNHPDVFIGQLSKYFIVYPIDATDRSAVINYRSRSLTSVVCKQLENVIAGYLMQAWVKNDWFYGGQHGLRTGYSCESQLITVCQDIAGSLDEGVGIVAIIIDFS